VKAGDTFFFGEDKHLWMIISDPEQDAERVLIVMFHTLRDLRHDPACVLEDGDHPFINRPTWVNYRRARITSIRALAALEANGELRRHEPLSDRVLLLICKGAADSDLIAYQHFGLMDEQGLRDFDD
jgi:hypothetical protein